MTASWTRKNERWRLLAPEGTVAIRLVPGLLGGRKVLARLRTLIPGTPVALLDYRPCGRLRVQRIMAKGLITVDHQYVALPSLRHAIILAEDSPDALSWAFRSLVAPPPGTTWAHAPVDAAVRFLRHRPGTAGWLAAGRVVIGRRA